MLRLIPSCIWCSVDCLNSQDSLGAFNQNWIGKWMTNGWKNSAKAEVANADLWKELAVLTATHQVTFSKVKGHADDELNNRCDELAVAESRKFK